MGIVFGSERVTAKAIGTVPLVPLSTVASPIEIAVSNCRVSVPLASGSRLDAFDSTA